MAEVKQKEENKIQHTKIEWVKNPDGTQGYTWNPITGCLNNCPYCYARKLANTRLKKLYLANKRVSTKTSLLSEYEDALSNPFYPRFWRDRLVYGLGAPDSQGYQRVDKAKGIFVCDMSDIFGIGIPGEWTAKVLTKIKEYPEHHFYLLTKQPQNLAKFQFPGNCWVGVSATGGEMAGGAIACLGEIEAKVKYLSFEPLLERIHMGGFARGIMTKAGIKWVIIGQQTPIRPETIPEIAWVEEIVTACDKAGVKVFLKNNLARCLPINELFMKRDSSVGWKLRQEMPSMAKEKQNKEG